MRAFPRSVGLLLLVFRHRPGHRRNLPRRLRLVAESLPADARPQALGMLQAFSALGNVAAGLISLVMVGLWSRNVIASYWRWMFSVGVCPRSWR